MLILLKNTELKNQTKDNLKIINPVLIIYTNHNVQSSFVN